MAEAEEVITDAARHVTVFARNLWRKHRVHTDSPGEVLLRDVKPRLTLFVTALFGRDFDIRLAQTPPPITLLERLFGRKRGPYAQTPVPATNGRSIWLPPRLQLADRETGEQLYRAMLVQQALRAHRNSQRIVTSSVAAPVLDVCQVLEAQGADQALVRQLPGMVEPLEWLRREALEQRPPISAFPAWRQPLEQLVRDILATPLETSDWLLPATADSGASEEQIKFVMAQWGIVGGQPHNASGLYKDWWTGELLAPPLDNGRCSDLAIEDESAEVQGTPRSGELPRRPQVREPVPGEDDDSQSSPWMIQGDEPHPHAEDPMGLQRPVDREEDMAADEYGDLLSNLPEARLVSTPGRPKEVLLSDDPPDSRGRVWKPAEQKDVGGLWYPEWDYRRGGYRERAVAVKLLSSQYGPQSWVTKTLETHARLIKSVQQRFEMLQARRQWHRKQLDGEEVDLDNYIDSYADFRAGHSLSQALYQTCRPTHRDMAITLLIDVSGSTDSWVSANRRVIDVEREALLLVCMALERLGEPYAVQAFSGEGPQAVTMRELKTFDEPYSNAVALRIAALEPEAYTRAGAALRHVTAGLMAQPASHRLLLLLSDGKPNDKDDYEGRYGVEDMRQAVTEASMQGIYPFCLTIDRQAAQYLPRIFGRHHYALLSQPGDLPRVLVEWIRKLIST